jgi:hypothetical protein
MTRRLSSQRPTKYRLQMSENRLFSANGKIALQLIENQEG